MKKIFILVIMQVLILSSNVFGYTAKNFTYNEQSGYKYDEELSGGGRVVFTNFIGESVAIKYISNNLKQNINNISKYSGKNTAEQLKQLNSKGFKTSILNEGIKDFEIYKAYCTKFDIKGKKAYQATCIIPENNYIYQVIISTTKEKNISDKNIKKVLDNLILPGYEEHFVVKDYTSLKIAGIVILSILLAVVIAIIIMFKLTGFTIFNRI